MIFRITWYNEDDHGPIDGLSAIVQADRDTNAHKLAMDAFLDMEIDFDSYEKLEIKDVTNEPIIHLRYLSMFG